MARSKDKVMKKVVAEGIIKGFRSAMRRRGTATVEANVECPTAYYVRITEVNSDGTFRGVLCGSAPYI